MIVDQEISILGVGTFRVQREHSFRGSSGELGHVARSHSLICPHCRTVWATLILDSDPMAWPVAGFCEEHPVKDTWTPIPGSILSEEGFGIIDTALLAALPVELLKREFLLHLKANQ